MLMHTGSTLPQLGSVELGLFRERLAGEPANSPTGEPLASSIVVGKLGRDAKIMSVGDVDNLTTDHGEQDGLAGELFLGDLEEVLVQNNDVGELSDLERADLLVSAEEAGAVDGYGLESRLARDAGAGREDGVEGRALRRGRVGVCRVSGASDGDLECKELVEGVNLDIQH